ncbi:MAG TPA: hypothetical protein VFM68_02310 [Candidatus Saccharimonadales bacterium]|nr:hypothetical protein [Candidatus Saccharimonadales bacterium]
METMMSTELIKANARLDAAAWSLREAYGTIDPGGRSVVHLDKVTMTYGMHQLILRYQTPSEQWATCRMGIVTHGNPSVAIETCYYDTTDQEERVVHYDFDRESGLTVVSNFAFYRSEVRPIDYSKDRAKLETSCSLGCPSLVNNDRTGVLTPVGVNRLAVDLERVLTHAYV